MAIVKIVPEKDWAVVKAYLCGRDMVLVPEHALNGFPDEISGKLRSMDDITVPYGFGGEPDHSVDVLNEYPSFQASELGLGGFD